MATLPALPQAEVEAQPLEQGRVRRAITSEEFRAALEDAGALLEQLDVDQVRQS